MFSLLVIDCEGLNLGSSWFSFRPQYLSYCPTKSSEFSLRFCRSHFLPPALFSFLTNPSILEILYDGRTHFCALYHTYHIDFNPGLDLQLVDICSRFARGDYSVASHERRLLRCFSQKQIRQNKDRFQNIYVLRSLGRCLEEHGCKSTSPKNHVNPETWLTRPLSSKYIEYAAHDVAIIHALYTQLIQVCYIQHPFLSLNLSQSKRCISIWNDAPLEQGNIFRSPPLLPLEIIDFILSQLILLSPAKGVLITYPLRLEFLEVEKTS
ncbi:hypothetical protein F5890DRAFT_758310 [Lentinula detonsa]|uniref:3'-5' exonuclease domain-containing protein n=1 Tax=Lentinula detonsa TaxID=2804962 RepID=A0AA38UP24_9AGAR|nr:hypothetical protein F5890DRAFT_758310 [Lentinula detonsa]